MEERVKKAFTDAWNAYKYNASMTSADKDWKKLLAMENKMLEESEHPEFLRGLLDVVNKDLERVSKENDRRNT